MTGLNINGLETITAMTGTRKEIYNKIAELNPIAIIDFRQSLVKIDDESYLIILKKIGNQFKIRIIWKIKGNKQFEF